VLALAGIFRAGLQDAFTAINRFLSSKEDFFSGRDDSMFAFRYLVIVCSLTNCVFS
jgi:hypothetical protein